MGASRNLFSECRLLRWGQRAEYRRQQRYEIVGETRSRRLSLRPHNRYTSQRVRFFPITGAHLIESPMQALVIRMTLSTKSDQPFKRFSVTGHLRPRPSYRAEHDSAFSRRNCYRGSSAESLAHSQCIWKVQKANVSLWNGVPRPIERHEVSQLSACSLYPRIFATSCSTDVINCIAVSPTLHT